MTSPAQAQGAVDVGPGPYPATGWGIRRMGGPIEPIPIERRTLLANDVLIDILYCGVCHSDIHVMHGLWMTPPMPCITGHEIVGRVAAVGGSVSKFRVGDIAGVSGVYDSDRTCDFCLDDREHLCPNVTFSSSSQDRVSGGITYGGFSTRLVVKEHFAVRIPPGADLPAMAPLLCAGITTFSPLQAWGIRRGQRVGVIGLGGLGHMAVKLAVAQGAEVVIFTTSPGKVADAKRLGAREAVLWSDAEAMQRLARSLDWAIATVPSNFPMAPFMEALRYDATLVNVGALETLNPNLNGSALANSRRKLSGSTAGGLLEIQQVVDYCVSHNIKSDIELIRPDQIQSAYDRIIKKDVRYRFVIDFASAENRK